MITHKLYELFDANLFRMNESSTFLQSFYVSFPVLMAISTSLVLGYSSDIQFEISGSHHFAGT